MFRRSKNTTRYCLSPTLKQQVKTYLPHLVIVILQVDDVTNRALIFHKKKTTFKKIDGYIHIPGWSSIDVKFVRLDSAIFLRKH